MPVSPGQKKQIEAFGKNLKRLRQARCLTQERLAELVELHPRALQKIEAGDVNVSLTTILQLKKALGQEWQTLFSWVD